MSDHHELREDPDSNEAVQAVVDRVLSYQAGAPQETARRELAEGCSEIGEPVTDDWLDQTAERIHRADPAQA